MTNNSKFVNKVVRNWLQNTTTKQRENFINIIYDILVDIVFNDFGVDTLKQITEILSTYKNVDKQDRKK